MTRISEVHGIPQNEFSDRGNGVGKSSYVPYLSLTVGEMKLALVAERARMLSQFYGSDEPQYGKAYQMIENALNNGAQNYKFVGAIADDLQDIARLIYTASRETQPVARGGIYGGAHQVGAIGQTIIPYEQRRQACLAEVDKKIKAGQLPAYQLAKALTECKHRFDIEKVINDRLEPGAHHMLYKSLPTGGALPTEVKIHRSLHRLGVEGMANVGEIRDYDLMYEWIENGILKKNMQGGVGAIGSQKSSFLLAPDPAKAQQQAGVARIGEPVIVTALVGLLLAAIGAAKKWLEDLQKIDARALVEARGFGTPEFSASKEQWEGPVETGDDTIMLLLLAAGAALVLSDN